MNMNEKNEREESLTTIRDSQESTITKPQEKVKEKSLEKVKEKPLENGNPKPKKQPRFRVLLWNDDDHTFEYVVKMMRKIFGYSKTRGMIIACGVHSCGKTPVAVLPLEVAELRRDQIRSFGPDPQVEGCVASMYATLEAIEED